MCMEGRGQGAVMGMDRAANTSTSVVCRMKEKKIEKHDS